MVFPLVIQKYIEIFFLANINKPFLNERELQLQLGLFLIDKGYKVYMEYFVPVNDLSEHMNEGESWKSDFYIDLVVEHQGQYIPIELKFKTKNHGDLVTTNRFGENINNGMFKDHSAHNQNLYNFWKDVRRLELLKKRFTNIVCGFSILLTNDKGYWQRKNQACKLFSMENEKIHTVDKRWLNEAQLEKDNPNFTVDNEYKTLWIPEDFPLNSFRYCLLKI